MSKANQKAENESFMVKVATFIVDKRNLVFLIVGIGLIFSAISRNWVEVENNLSEYLPSDSNTRIALDVMEEQFTTFGTADYMFANITLDEAYVILDDLENWEGVESVDFDESTDHYNNVSALFSVTFSYPEEDDTCVEIMDAISEKYSDYDVYLKTELGNATAEIVDREVTKITVFVAIIVVAVLLFTSQTYAEVPVLLITFVAAMVLNLGSNFLLGKISFVSNSVTSILQLALSLDYAVILCNRFKEEHQTLDIREATIVALSKAIPEITASSLTTVGGLVAMIFMKFKIGPDMGVCLIKAIAFALFSVFVLMPGLLVLFGPLMDKTKHKNFIPKIPFVGKFDYATRIFVPIIFVALIIGAYKVSNNCPYVYGYGTITTPKLNETQIAEQMIKENFTSSNMVAVIVPVGDYDKEKKLLAELDAMPEVNYTKGLANTEAMDGYMVADKLTPRQFAELAGIDYEVAQLAYTAYATQNGEYERLVGGISTYSVPLIDIFLFVCDVADEGYVDLDDDLMDSLHDAQTKMQNGRLQLEGPDYSRMLVYLNLPVSGDETYEFTDTIKEIAQSYYPDGNVYVVGNSTSEYDFEKSFARDNTVVSVLSILIVLVVLLFTFKSAGMPVLLILVIQGSIWINFSFPVFTHTDLFFLSYLIVSSIQMGANIDYAIVIASRYMELVKEMDRREAIIETMNFAFPTIITSGTILAASGILIGQMTSEAAIVGIGQSLGRGTIISIFLVMFILPQILIVGGKVVAKTSFKTPDLVIKRKIGFGRMIVDGMVSGEIKGNVHGILRGTVDGEVNVQLLAGSIADAAEKQLAIAMGKADDTGETSSEQTDTAGTDTAGTGTETAAAAGTDTAGNDAAGSGAVGTDAAGNDATGSDAAGTDAAGNDVAGNDTAGREAVGTAAGVTIPAGDSLGAEILSGTVSPELMPVGHAAGAGADNTEVTSGQTGSVNAAGPAESDGTGGGRKHGFRLFGRSRKDKKGEESGKNA